MAHCLQRTGIQASRSRVGSMMAVDERMSVAPCESVLFVDAENAGTIDLSAIPNDVLVRFFFGASQKKVSTEFLRAALKLGERFSETNVDGAGNNALDFHIAF